MVSISILPQKALNLQTFFHTLVFSWLYLPRTKNIIQKYPKLFQLSTINREQFEEDFLNSKPVFESYEQFLEYVESK